MKLPTCTGLTKKAAGQFVYRNVLRLEQRGLLESSTDPVSKRTIYKATAMLDEIKTEYSTKAQEQYANCRNSSEPGVRELKDRLNEYKVSLLTTKGEIEEYEFIYESSPGMREEIQQLYNQARDRCSLTLGKVKALEAILSNQQCG